MKDGAKSMPFSHKLVQRIPARLRANYSFIFPSAIALPIQQKRIDFIHRRVRLLAAVLAVCLPAWSLLDAFVFPRSVWLSLLAARCLASVALVVYLVFRKHFRWESISNLLSVYIQLGIIFVVPTLFYDFCIGIPEQVTEMTAFANAITSSYHLLPFIILAGLGFFPLTLLESASIVMPFMTAYYLSNGSPDVLHWSTQLGMIWSMALLAIISVVVGCSQLSTLIQLVSYSSYDSLTNCLGRRSGEEIVKALWYYSVRKKSHLSFAFIDLDHFKLVNDQFGHQAGDAVLFNVAASIKSSLRESDFVIRWGGEEFLILLPDASLEDATHVFTRMAKKGFGALPDGTLQTVSMGIAERIHENIDDRNEIIKIADYRLYQAKTAGRARMVGTSTTVLGN